MYSMGSTRHCHQLIRCSAIRHTGLKTRFQRQFLNQYHIRFHKLPNFQNPICCWNINVDYDACRSTVLRSKRKYRQLRYSPFSISVASPSCCWLLDPDITNGDSHSKYFAWKWLHPRCSLEKIAAFEIDRFISLGWCYIEPLFQIFHKVTDAAVSLPEI